jgi:hypothetical protein
MKSLVYILGAIMLSGTTALAVDLAPNFNFDGVLLDTNGSPLATGQTITFKITNPAGTCILYEETQTGVAVDALGNFSVKVGAGTRTGNDPALNFRQIFQNEFQVRPVGANCGGGYTPAIYQGRKMYVTVGAVTLTPAFDISPTPMAQVAESIQGLQPSDFVRSIAASGAPIPTMAGDPGTIPAAGYIWYDTGSNKLRYSNGSVGADISSGAVGPTGPAGGMGPTGPTGANGATGSVGNTGIAGASGATGATGASGSTGATGATGATGMTGATGATGASGVDGMTGATGATGAGLSGLSAGGVTFADSGTSIATAAPASNFYWDNTNMRLGLGTSTPAVTLEVAGHVRLGGHGGTSDDKYPTLELDGRTGDWGGKLWSLNGNAGGGDPVHASYFRIGNNTNGDVFIIGPSGEMMIGYQTIYDMPQSKLDIAGGVAIGTYAGSSLGAPAPANGLIVSGDVGIGTNAPSERLHVVGNFRYQDGNQAAGKILTSDAAGIASWQTPAAEVTTSGPNTWTDGNQSIQTSTDGQIGLHIKGFSPSQTGPLLSIETSGGTPIYSFDPITFALTGSIQQVVPDGRDSANAVALIQNDDVTPGQGHGLNITAGNNNSDMSLSVFARAGGPALLMVRGDGKIGMGTSSPAEHLRIEGIGNQNVVVNSTDSSGSGYRVQLNGSERAALVAGTSMTGLFANNGNHLQLGSNDSTQADQIYMDPNGNVGIKNVTPSAQLHLPAGVNSVGKAPLKFTAGTNLTTPEVGAMEFDGTNLFYSVTGPSRKTIATMDALTNFVGKTGDTMTGNLVLPTGTAGASSVQFGSSNSGVFAPAASELGISTAGVERMRINSTGYVGIGTTTPTSSFEMRQTFDAPNILTVSTPGTGTSQQAGILLETKSDGSTNIGTDTNALGWMLWANGDTYGGPDGPSKHMNFMYWDGGQKVKALSLNPSGGATFFGLIGSAGPVTNLGACGGAGTAILGTNVRGKVTTGSTASASCIINFANAPLPAPPICVVSWADTPAASITIGIASITTNNITIAFSSTVANRDFSYICMQ